MPSEWRAFWDRWTDERGWVVWILPISGIAIIAVTAITTISVYLILTTPSKWGGNIDEPRVLGFFAISAIALLAMFYISIGVVQLFFLELRQKFIARSVVWDGKGYELKGYYFKQANFTPADLARIDEYRVDHRYFGSTILTLLNRTPKANYRVRLKDGREFYLPAEISRVGQLTAQLEADIRAQNGS